MDFADDGAKISSIRFVYNPKHAIAAGVRLKHVIAVRSMEQNFGAWQTIRD